MWETSAHRGVTQSKYVVYNVHAYQIPHNNSIKSLHTLLNLKFPSFSPPPKPNPPPWRTNPEATTTDDADAMAFSPKGKVVVVTGGANGIGAALCHRFAAEGASRVVVVDLHAGSASSVAEALPGGVGAAIGANCGVEMDLRRVILQTEFEHGPIDVFCANAGIPSNGSFDVPNDEWERIWRVNAMQHVWVARYLFPKWIERGSGYLVVTASAAGLLSQVGSLPYTVTKHASVAMAEWLAITYASKGIQVSCLCPQAVATGMLPDGTGGMAGNDGVLQAEDVVQELMLAMCEGRFLVTPHKNVLTYVQRKAADHGRWLRGMQRQHAKFGELTLNAPNLTAAKL